MLENSKIGVSVKQNLFTQILKFHDKIKNLIVSFTMVFGPLHINQIIFVGSSGDISVVPPESGLITRFVC